VETSVSEQDIAELLQLTRESTLQLTAAVTAIRDLAASLAKQDRTLAAQDRRGRWLSRGIALLAVVVLGAGLLSFSNRQVISALKDCTEPGGQCFNQAQTRQAKVVDPLAQQLDDIQARGNDNRRLLCLSIPPERRPADLCSDH
jgi:hypothetical protein